MKSVGCNQQSYGKDKGDFKVDSKYHFEIGSKDKTFKQIANLPDSYIFADDIESPVGAKLPLWMLVFCSYNNAWLLDEVLRDVVMGRLTFFFASLANVFHIANNCCIF